MAVAICFCGLAQGNPTGPTVVSGSASFQQSGNLLQIVNTPKAIINWQSFSIGAGEITRFVQQSSSSSVLNRVTTQNPSSILGTLQSNGRVFLINPSGIVFGKGSLIDTAGLVASSLNLSNADFLAGRMNFTTTSGAGPLVNQGAIHGNGGSVYLVGSAVTNSGIITSPRGEVVLAAGNSVELVNPATPNLRVEITASRNQAVNLGEISAEAGRVGIYAGLIRHSGSIRADSAEIGRTGQVILKATERLALEPGSTISARGSGGADGGFIETSAARVEIDPVAVVTAAAPGGRAGTWLIDPVDITIVHAGGSAGPGTIAPATSMAITDGTINATLDGGTDVVIQTSGGTGGNGDITINGSADPGGAAVILNSSGGARSFTLIAERNVIMNPGSSIGESTGNSLSISISVGAGGTGSFPTGSIGGFVPSSSIVLTTGTVTVSPGASVILTSVSTGTSTGGIPPATPIPGGPSFGGTVVNSITQTSGQVVHGLTQIGDLLNPSAPGGAPPPALPSCKAANALKTGACTP